MQNENQFFPSEREHCTKIDKTMKMIGITEEENE